MPDFEAFFQAATGSRPYGYQARIARAGLPSLLRVPDGAGKTAVILAWLWRRLHGPDQAGTPRRLMYVLPPRSLTEPVSARLLTWLANLDLTDEVAVHVVRGGRNESTGDWRENPHQPAIVVGPADLLVSKALNRAYGTGRAGYPIDFALAGNGAHWIVDEQALCPQAAATLRQLAGLAAAAGTAEPFGLTCCTAVGGARPPGGRDRTGGAGR
jgi:CRISPR-associated endonuclease/helicase Cas3